MYAKLVARTAIVGVLLLWDGNVPGGQRVTGGLGVNDDERDCCLWSMLGLTRNGMQKQFFWHGYGYGPQAQYGVPYYTLHSASQHLRQQHGVGGGLMHCQA